MQRKKGVSLIVLVITIIVMVILAGVIILTLNNSGIINKASEAVNQTNEAQVYQLAQVKWAEAYLNTDKSQEKLEEYVLAELTEEGIDTNAYIITVTTNGVDVMQKPESLVDIVDSVPIPKGFVASPYNGENTKDGGMVIYELTSDEMQEGISELPEETQQISWTTRNQYVWIPVNDFTEFKRYYFGVGYGNNYWEVVLDESTNMPLATLEEQEGIYISEETLAEVQAMYASVKKYGGFYIARYEAGIDEQRTSYTAAIITGSNIHSKMNKIPYNNIRWSTSDSQDVDTGGAVEAARSIYPNDSTNTTGVISTLTYAVQWDRTCLWLQETEAKDINGNVINIKSRDWGNYYDRSIGYSDLNEGAQYSLYSSNTLKKFITVASTSSKSNSTGWALTTGALKKAKTNNIYDLSGNMQEWTMEGVDTTCRATRGGGCLYQVKDNATYGRYVVKQATPNVAAEYLAGGFRATLYIK